MSVSYALTQVPMEWMSTMDKTATGVPTHIAIDPEGKVYVWPWPKGKR